MYCEKHSQSAAVETLVNFASRDGNFTSLTQHIERVNERQDHLQIVMRHIPENFIISRSHKRFTAPYEACPLSSRTGNFTDGIVEADMSAYRRTIDNQPRAGRSICCISSIHGRQSSSRRWNSHLFVIVELVLLTKICSLHLYLWLFCALSIDAEIHNSMH